MKTIGLIGGMSWESTAEYYRVINQEMNRELGGLHSAKCIVFSVDFEEIERCQVEGEWEKAGEILGEAALSLEKAGADFIVLCTNTMHKVNGAIQDKIHVPFIHIADATATEIKQEKLVTVGLIGTKYTMEQDFYKSRIEAQGIKVLVPSQVQRAEINRVIFEELCLGEIQPSSRDYYLEVIDDLVKEGAEGIILGCTEIGMLIKQEDTHVTIFDTTKIHAVAAVRMALHK